MKRLLCHNALVDQKICSRTHDREGRSQIVYSAVHCDGTGPWLQQLASTISPVKRMAIGSTLFINNTQKECQ